MCWSQKILIEPVAVNRIVYKTLFHELCIREMVVPMLLLLKTGINIVIIFNVHEPMNVRG